MSLLDRTYDELDRAVKAHPGWIKDGDANGISQLWRVPKNGEHVLLTQTWHGMGHNEPSVYKAQTIKIPAKELVFAQTIEDVGEWMTSRLELIIEVEHPAEYDPADHFVYYFSDDDEFIPDRENSMIVIEENWTEAE